MKNVLIVGACGGMGKAIAEKLINKGYNTFGIDIADSSDVQGLHYRKCNITSEEQVASAFAEVSSQVDELFAIIFAAGIYKMDSLLEISDQQMKKIVDVNVLSVQRINRVFFPLLRRNSRLVIITSEVAVLDPLPFNGIYSITKSFLEKYAFSLRMEVNNFGIKVVTVRPGAVKTNMIGASTTSLDEFVGKTVIHKQASTRFRKIVNSVESKTVEPAKIGNLINKILSKKNPKYTYSINRNIFLKLLNVLPDRWQVWIISKILKEKE